jgi:hypothetical protein
MYLHGDYAGLATGLIEREHPGSIGLFLQGAEGDVNSAVCCLANDQVLGALDIMASRYARAVRNGLEHAEPVVVDAVRGMRPGSVIIDLAAERGGNCELTRADQRVVEHGVVILGPTNLPAEVAILVGIE